MKWRRRLKILFAVFLVFNLVLFLSGHYCFARVPEKLYARALKHAPYDAIIVPGIPFNGKTWDKIMKGRVLWAKHLYDIGVAKNLIFSGSAVHSPYVEAQVMAMYAEQLGIPKDHIFIETKAEHSVENVYYSNLLAGQMHFTSIALATDPFQSLMLGWYISDKHLSIDRIPMVKSIMDTMPPYDQVKIDAQPAFIKDFVPLEKRKTAWQQWRGTMGKV